MNYIYNSRTNFIPVTSAWQCFKHTLLKSYRKSLKKKPDTEKPYIYKQFLIVDSSYYKIFYDHIQIPTGPR